MTTKESHRRAWKKNESQIAAVIGGKRVPVSGRQRGDAPDIEHNFLSIEVKLRARLPGWLHNAMHQAEASARGNQTPVAVLREKGQVVGKAFVVMRLEEFQGRFLPEADD